MLRHAQRSTLFPYTTLFRSAAIQGKERRDQTSRGGVGEPSNLQSSGSPGSYGARSLIRSEEHTSELQSRGHLVCRLLLEKKNNKELELLDKQFALAKDDESA